MWYSITSARVRGTERHDPCAPSQAAGYMASSDQTDEFQVWHAATCELLTGYRLCRGNPCSSALFPPFSRRGARPEGTRATYEDVKTKVRHHPPPNLTQQSPAARSLQPLTPVGVKAKDRKAAMPGIDFSKKQPTKKTPLLQKLLLLYQQLPNRKESA